MLTQYQTDTLNLLGQGVQSNLYPTATITNYINRARNQIAQEGQCVRVLPPISSGIASISVTSGGIYAGPPSVIISGPDSPSGQLPNANGLQATATAVLSGSAVASVIINNPGSGYFQPQISFSSGSAAATATVLAAYTNPGQEVYPFSAINPVVATSGSGISGIYMINTKACIWGTFRYVLMQMSFSRYQAAVRTYTAGYQYIPAVAAQFGQGVNGSLYLYPIPNSNYQIEFDSCCQVNALDTDASFEAIPSPWADCVPFLASYYALMGSQRNDDAKWMWSQYQLFMKRARQMTQPRSVGNWYGRGG